MKKPAFHLASSFLVWGLSFTLIGAVGPVSANVLSNKKNVVRIQGDDVTMGATSSLIGMAEYGTTLRMVFLGTDHAVERFVVTTIGFGNVDLPIVNLDARRARISKMGPTGTEDIAICGITVDLTTLTPEQQSFLKGLTPFSVATSPTESSLPFEIIDYGFGLSNVSQTYGTQNSFTNMITRYFDFSGSYTTDKDGNPLIYAQPMEVWNFLDPGGAGIHGFSGSPLIYNGAIQGIQVNGSRSSTDPVNWGLRFSDTEVAWINTQRDAYLHPIIPAINFLLLE